MLKTCQEVLTAFVLVFVISADSLACSCVGGSIDEIIERADVIVVAELINATLTDKMVAKGTFEVSEILKGESPKSLTLRAETYDSQCGVPLILGQDYVLLLTEESDFIGSCSGSGPLGFHGHGRISHMIYDRLQKLHNEQ